MKRFLSLLLCCTLTLSFFACDGQEPAQDPTPESDEVTMDMPLQIVVPDDPATIEQTAAGELAAYLAEITGTEPAILPQSGYSEGSAFFIHTNVSDFPEAEEALSTAELGEEGAFYAIGGKGVYLDGGSTRGSLYSVYCFLEQELGCRYYAENCRVIPKQEELTFQKKVWQYVPQLIYRSTSFVEDKSQGFAAFNRLNATANISEEYGGTVKFGVGSVHTLPILVPDELFETHPEYFPEINGERCHGDGYQRCLTNPDVLEMTIEAVREAFRKNPSAKIASVSQADTGDISNHCTCPACQAVNEEEGSLMGTQLRFVNAVADAIREEFPDRYIETLAYRFTRHVCQKTAPRDNVIIRLCSIECCFAHPLSECPENAAFVKDLEDWAKVAKNLYIWDYVTDFAYYVAPQPNLGVLGANMRYYADHHVIGMYPEGAWNSRGAEMAELKAWLLAKLQWDPDFDTEAGTEEFIRAYFGTAAEPMLAYVNALNGRAAKTETHRNCYADPDPEFFTKSFLDACKENFEEAKELAEDDTVLERVCRWEMSVRFVDLTVYRNTYDWRVLEGMVDDYIADVGKYGIDRLYEGGAPEDMLNWMRWRCGLPQKK